MSTDESIVGEASSTTFCPEMALLGTLTLTFGGMLRTVTEAVLEFLAPSSSVAWKTTL